MILALSPNFQNRIWLTNFPKTERTKRKMRKRVFFLKAESEVLGRLASRIVALIENKTSYPSDRKEKQILVGSADQLRVSKNKIEKRVYYKHSGFPGGLREIRLSSVIRTRPDWVLRRAVRGMLPKNRLRRKKLRLLQLMI
ncbi:50S ribosomal subunit protein L13 [Candidatus Tremblaya phenacola PAVE]|nr:50S ribosomal subunit protein L13 [Candidatus Tremblaya phenacola PAVE]